MATFRSIKILLVCVIALFGGAAFYTSFLINARQDALVEYSRYNVAWLVAQATSELARLQERLSSFQIPNSGTDRAEVMLRFDIVVNRGSLLSKGVVEEFIRAAPEHGEAVEEFNQVVAEADQIIQDIDQPGVAGQILQMFVPLDKKITRLAAAANRWVGDQVAKDQRELIRLHWVFSGLSGALIACGVALIGLLIWHNAALRRAHGELRETTADLRKTSEELAYANLEVRTQNERFNAALNNMSQGLCMVDCNQRLIVCNKRYVEMFGLSIENVVPGVPLPALLSGQGDVSVESVLLSMVPGIGGEQDVGKTPTSFVRDVADGRTIAVAHQPMRGGGWVATYEDITERRQAEARVVHMAQHDALTDLPNRLLFHESMERAFARQRRHNDHFAILCLDLDRFKSVNDTLGHPAGDALLKEVATRLLKAIRDTDVVARLGGDEFAVLQTCCEAPDSADRLARRLLAALSVPYDLDGQQVIATTSIGIAIAPGGGTSPDQLLKNADTALYRAKASGRNTYRFFEERMDVELQERRMLEIELRGALDKNEFQLNYQPLVKLGANQITGCEALLRWRHPKRGMVPPSQFIPVAEEIGFVVALGEWVLRTACREAVKWPADVKVAINLSPVQFKGKGIKQLVVNALDESGLPASRLELEVTESVLLEDDESTLLVLHQLREIGVNIALDDFGTGYSSLSYLRSFPFDKIKIDRSFVQDLSSRSDCLAIVQSVATLGRSLGMVTTGEGVETVEQARQLRNAGCTEAQGYLFGRPQPAESIRSYLREHTHVRVEAA